MRDPLSRLFSSLPSSPDSLIHRIRENFRQLLTPAGIFPSSANGAPLHLLSWRHSTDTRRSRTISFLTHVGILSAILFLHFQSNPRPAPGTATEPVFGGAPKFLPFLSPNRFGQPSLGVKSGGGEKDSRPARHGFLAPGSSVPLLPPRKVINPSPELPVTASVFDPNAPQFPVPITNLGLPWMKENSDSAGPGKDHGFGAGKKGGMGDDEGPGAGQDESYNGPYQPGVTGPICAYCPDPQYTDEAREAKLQGKVTLRVLIGADGRAAQVRVLQGPGMGLDERAVQSVRAWRFIPAHDGTRRTVPTWVTIEVVFRLI